MKYDPEKDYWIVKAEVFDRLSEEILKAFHSGFMAVLERRGVDRSKRNQLWREMQCTGLEEYLKVGAQDFLHRELESKRIQILGKP